ncbi:MAG TPA: aminotransferase class III-fold pyridoxal phosphate-dependent enzyme [Steroidobacteraceae bacterium]|nr:aminotransferase class III-fold pyridoxal phosphate-dependent enzyme [Steroidobacteraceae bacterium]
MTSSDRSAGTHAGGGMQCFWASPGDAPLERVSRAQGVHVWDTAGRRYIDVTSGPVAVNLGHGNPRVLRAMQEQAARVCFAYPTAFESDSNIRLTERLTAQAGMRLERAFFVSGGSEAVEKALQFARRYALAIGRGSRYKVISRNPSYHGSTRATMALSADPGYAPYLVGGETGFHVPAPWSYRVPDDTNAAAYAQACAEALREKIVAEGPETVLAFILEPVMGFSGGATYAPPEYYRRVREICDELDVLLIFDETISGAGRTGKFLAAHWWPEARPDMVTLAKGIGGGYYPLAAFLAPARMVDAVVHAGGFHLGHTHKGQPLACAVGLAVLEETLEQKLIERAYEAGVYLRSRLNTLKRDIPVVGDVRGLGLLNAIEIVADQDSKEMLPRSLDVIGRVQALARERGLLIYGRRTHGGRFGDWIMVTPPLIATNAELDEIVDGLGATLRAFAAEVLEAR